MNTKNTTLPLSTVEVDTRGGKSTVTLWDGTHKEAVNQDGKVEYEFSIYQIQVLPRANLAQAVQDSFSVWLEAAKAEEQKQIIPPIEERVGNLETESDALADVLAAALGVSL